MIIVLEGIDGCGKGTQADLLVERCAKQDPGTGRIKMPVYETPLGRLIVDWLHGKISLSGEMENPHYSNALALQAIMQANKLEGTEMFRHYDDSSFLVVDRYWQSGVAYGSAVDGLDYDMLTKWGSYLPQAHLNILVDIPVNVALERQKNRGRKDIYEGKQVSMLRASDSYHELWSRGRDTAPEAWVTVNGDQPINDVHECIWNAVLGWLAIPDASYL